MTALGLWLSAVGVFALAWGGMQLRAMVRRERRAVAWRPRASEGDQALWIDPEGLEWEVTVAGLHPDGVHAEVWCVSSGLLVTISVHLDDLYPKT